MSRKSRTNEEINLYLITSRTEPADEDCYKDAIVAAYSINEAKATHPCGNSDAYWDDEVESWGDEEDDDSWVPPDEVVAELIGVGADHLSPGVVLARFTDEAVE